MRRLGPSWPAAVLRQGAGDVTVGVGRPGDCDSSWQFHGDGPDCYKNWRHHCKYQCHVYVSIQTRSTFNFLIDPRTKSDKMRNMRNVWECYDISFDLEIFLQTQQQLFMDRKYFFSHCTFWSPDYFHNMRPY